MTRPPPAFMCYASDWLAKEPFRLASLTERGLLWTMLNQAWVSESLPAAPEELARLLALPSAEARDALTPHVLSQFQRTESGRLICPELESYRDDLRKRHQERSESGKRGAEAKHRRADARGGSAMAQPHPAAMAAPEMKGAESNEGDLRKTASTGKSPVLSAAPLSEEGEAEYLAAWEDKA